MMNEDALYLLLVPLMLNNPILLNIKAAQSNMQIQQFCVLFSALPLPLKPWTNILKLLILS